MPIADRHGRHLRCATRWGRWAAAVSTGLLCSCAGTGSSSFSFPSATIPNDEGIAKISAPAASPALEHDRGIVLTGAVHTTSHADAIFSPADRRMPLAAEYPAGACPPGCPPGCPPYGGAVGLMPGGVALVGAGGARLDEFLCDGGDRLPPVHYDRTFRHGLDTEDTIGEWVDPQGRLHVTPSNKVCVYAPRFGEVRTFSTPVGGMHVDRLISANEVTRGVGLEARTFADAKVQKTAIDAARVRSRASGLDVDHTILGLDQATTAALHLKDEPPIVGLNFLQSGQLTRGEEAFLAQAMQAAIRWTRAEYPVIAATDVAAQEVRVEFRPSEIIGHEDMNKPGSLRVVKLADKAAASIGEIVTFTIRYDNLGDKPVHHVRIIDNLTPRLELVEGSATSDHAGRLDIEPNGEGSFVLTFVIDEPLPGKTGGTVTFQTRVR